MCTLDGPRLVLDAAVSCIVCNRVGCRLRGASHSAVLAAAKPATAVRGQPKARRSTATCSTIRPGSSAPVITGFWQEQPDEGQPASENTEVRIIFTRDTLYIGVVCFDREPGSIIVSDSRRDAGLDDTDSFRIIFDTYSDRQNGFVFGTNPAAIEYDGQVTNEGQGGGGLGGGSQQSGSGGGFNLNWDAAWEVRTKIDERGWSAEFAIPFRTLRFPSGADQMWGVNFQRNIRRRNERAYWAPIPRQYSLYRLSLAGTVVGHPGADDPQLQGDAVRAGQRRWPRACGRSIRRCSAMSAATSSTTLTPSLTLDGTINTDFAQVEVDDQQVNLDRFTLFFPEKRPFFLENAGFFSVGNPGEIDLFFSRRIGIGDNGEAIPHHRRRPRVGQGRRLQHRPAQHADRRLSASAAEQQLHRSCASAATCRTGRRSAGIFVNRQGTGELRRGRRSQPHLRGRRQVGRRPEHGALELRRAHRNARRRRRRLRVQRAIAHQRAAIRPRARVSGGRRQLQPGGRVPQPPRLSQAGRARADAIAAEGLPQPAGVPAARVVSQLLGASTGSRKPATCTSTTTGSSAMPTRSTPA